LSDGTGGLLSYVGVAPWQEGLHTTKISASAAVTTRAFHAVPSSKKLGCFYRKNILNL